MSVVCLTLSLVLLRPHQLTALSTRITNTHLCSLDLNHKSVFLSLLGGHETAEEPRLKPYALVSERVSDTFFLPMTPRHAYNDFEFKN